VWDDRRDVFVTGIDVYAQHVLGDGQIAPGWPVDGLPISTDPGLEELGQLLADGQGGVFIVWSTATSVFVQRLQGDGTRFPGWPASGVQLLDISGPTGDVWNWGAVPDGQGGCLVVTGDERRGIGPELYVHRVTGDGQIPPGWPVNGSRVADAAANQVYRIYGKVVSDGQSGLYLGWSSTIEPNLFEADVYATHVLADGSVAVGWPTTGLPVAALPLSQQLSGAASDSQGGVLFAWGDQRDYDNYASRVFVVRLGPDGTPPPGWQPQGNPMSDLPGYHFGPVLAGDDNGGGFVAYQEAFGMRGYVQRFHGDGTLAAGWPSVGLPLVDPSIASSTTQQDIVIAPDGEGGAVVVWNDFRGTFSNQLFAQRYTGDDITAVTMSLVRHEALPDRVSLTWARGGLGPTEAAIERRSGGTSDWQFLATAPFDGSGRLDYEDASVVAGTRYAYRLRWSESDGEHTSNDVEIEVPHAIALALNGLRPNPAQGEPYVSFALPTSGRTTLELLDLGGRVVRRKDASGLGVGRHVVRMDEGERLHPGVYWVRLTHDDRTLSAKGMVLR